MKNKGRRHKASRDQELYGMSNCKSNIAHITRPITSMASRGFGEGRTEIAKCEVRCANCHRRITHKRRISSLVGESS